MKYMELLSLITEGSIFICEKNHGFIEEVNPSSKVVTMEEELDTAKVYRFGSLIK